MLNLPIIAELIQNLGNYVKNRENQKGASGNGFCRSIGRIEFRDEPMR